MRALPAGIVALSALGVGYVACKLDLDESLIGGSDASTDGAGGGVGGDSALADGKGGGGGGSGGSGGTGGKEAGPPCSSDPECNVDAGCLEGKCLSNNCVYELCPAPSACEGRTCDTTSNTCSAATSFGFKATTVELLPDIGCGGSAARCVAGFGDYVFAATSDGVLHAWRLTNPAAPEAMTIESPTFIVNQLIAAQDRLLVLSAVNAGKLQAAWVDLPADPQSTTLTLASAGVSFTSPLSAAYPGALGGFLLVENDSAAFYPAAYVDPPLTNNSTITKYPSTGLVTNAIIVASSGTRLVSFRADASGATVVPNFTLIAQAGTGNAQNGSETKLAYECPTSLAAQTFASGFDGSVLWSANRVFRDDAGSARTLDVAVRWLTAGGSDAFDPAPSVTIATYSEADANVARSGPSAVIDALTALVTVAYPADSTQTLVKSVTKGATALTLGSGSAVLPFKASDIGAAATRKYGVVLTPKSTSPALNATLHVFAPSCG